MGGGGFDVPQQVQEAYVEYHPQKATIEIKPDNESAAKIVAHIPDSVYYTALIIGLLVIGAYLLRKTGLNKPIKAFFAFLLRLSGLENK